MTTLQNLTGVTLPDEKKKALVDMLSERDVPLIEDDVYRELRFSRDRPLPAKAFDTKGLVMHCSSFSKTLASGYAIYFTIWSITSLIATSTGCWISMNSGST